MMELMSAEIGDITLALSKAQAQMGPAFKDKKNPFFKSSYADLSSCITAIREPFGNNDLCFFQATLPMEGGMVRIVTTISHKSGQWIRGILDIKPTKNDPQGIGSAISYGKRYGIQALSGLPTDDDDGEGAMGRGGAKKKPSRENAPPDKKPGTQNIWAAGAWDKYNILCKENNLDKTQAFMLLGFYLEQSKCQHLTQKGSEMLVNQFSDILKDFKSRKIQG